MTPYPPAVEDKMSAFFSTLSEKEKRRYAAVETIKLGHGGQTYIAEVLGSTPATIRRGLAELDNDLQGDDPGRVRRSGGGRKPYDETHPEINRQFLEVLADHTAGDPTDDTLRWTNLTQQKIADCLRENHDVDISVKVVRQLLQAHGFRRRKAQKNKAIKEVEGRNEQFEKIARLKADYQNRGEPVISVDTKKKST